MVRNGGDVVHTCIRVFCRCGHPVPLVLSDQRRKDSEVEVEACYII